ncbi:MAG: tRNA-intron lyase [Candidatus Anstonellales archaeon]
MQLKGKISIKGNGLFSYKGTESEKNRIYARGIGTFHKDELILNINEAFLLNEVFSIDFELNEMPSFDISNYVVFRELFMKGFKYIKDIQERDIKASITDGVIKIYKSHDFNIDAKAVVLGQDKQFAIIKGDKDLYYKYWFGQYGSYKKHYGNLFLLDFYECQFLKELNVLSGSFRPYYRFFDDIYSIYKDWRSKGYVLKTGFKFGGDFRIYEPNAQPDKGMHSKHIIHVFPKGLFLDAEQWSRAIRVCHGVKKSYIIAIPKSKEKIVKFKPDGLIKRNNEIYVLKILKQQDFVRGSMLASALDYCIKNNLPLLLCLVDREAAVTFYKAERIKLENSDNIYYEINWVNMK